MVSLRRMKNSTIYSPSEVGSTHVIINVYGKFMYPAKNGCLNQQNELI